MKQVIRINEQSKEEKELKPTEFTHVLHEDEGWREKIKHPNYYNKIIYLGCCRQDGDMFSAYDDGAIRIYKGHLNDGVY